MFVWSILRWLYRVLASIIGAPPAPQKHRNNCLKDMDNALDYAITINETTSKTVQGGNDVVVKVQQTNACTSPLPAGTEAGWVQVVSYNSVGFQVLDRKFVLYTEQIAAPGASVACVGNIYGAVLGDVATATVHVVVGLAGKTFFANFPGNPNFAPVP
jgi:hypothetical protein